MMKWERTCGIFGPNIIQQFHNVECIETNGTVSLQCKSGNKSYDATKLNMCQGITAQYVSTTILTESDRQVARQCTQKLKKEGTTMTEQVDTLNRRITGGKMTLDLRQYGLFSNK